MAMRASLVVIEAKAQGLDHVIVEGDFLQVVLALHRQSLLRN